MLVGGEYAIGQAVVVIEFGQLMQEGLPVFIFTAHDSPHWRGFKGHRIVDAVCGECCVAEPLVFVEPDEFPRDALDVFEIGEFSLPVVSLLMEKLCQFDELGIASAVVEPEHAQDFVMPAELAPVAQRARGQLRKLICKVALHDGDNALVARRFLILGKRFEHDHARPPVVVRVRADHAVGLLIVECPVDVFLRFGFETRVVKQICERHKAINEVGTAFPGFAGAAEPARVRTYVCPGFVEVPAETVGLNL